jgi:hypothetical protein
MHTAQWEGDGVDAVRGERRRADVDAICTPPFLFSDREPLRQHTRQRSNNVNSAARQACRGDRHGGVGRAGLHRAPFAPPLRNPAHPLCTRFAKSIGALIYEVTMRPNPVGEPRDRQGGPAPHRVPGRLRRGPFVILPPPFSFI